MNRISNIARNLKNALTVSKKGSSQSRRPFRPRGASTDNAVNSQKAQTDGGTESTNAGGNLAAEILSPNLMRWAKKHHVTLHLSSNLMNRIDAEALCRISSDEETGIICEIAEDFHELIRVFRDYPYVNMQLAPKSSGLELLIECVCKWENENTRKTEERGLDMFLKRFYRETSIKLTTDRNENRVRLRIALLKEESRLGFAPVDSVGVGAC